KSALMARIDQEWAALEQVLRDLNETQMTTIGPEGWSVKDHLAHIVTWEKILLIAHLQGHSFGEAAGMDQATSDATEQMTAETGLNDFFHERDKSRPLADVLTDFRQSHQALMAALEPLAYEELLKPRHPDDPHSDLLIQVVASDTYEHYQEHRIIIQKITA
ncbi:MAG: ClbS/DfsB family four-helix bundle protein, partial [Chloroflexi bacterium]|nr:ClbS/DfsB family four-helix bundle protein [Chloroflexota bacterium]